jgi:rubrerythrin
LEFKLKKLSRRDLRKIILNEMGIFPDLKDLLKDKPSYKEISTIPGETDIPGMIGIRSAIANLPDNVEKLCELLERIVENLPSTSQHVSEEEGNHYKGLNDAIENILSRLGKK